MSGIRTQVATPERWNDVVEAFGRRGDDPDWCWCQRFMAQSSSHEVSDNRSALQLEIRTAPVAPGLIAYVDDSPMGWTRAMPRHLIAGVSRNRALQRVLTDDPGAWWVTCFAVDRAARRIGVATALLNAAVAHARAQGATSVQGHPVDVSALKASDPSASALFTGTLQTFQSAGFTEIARTYPSRPVMERRLHPNDTQTPT